MEGRTRRRCEASFDMAIQPAVFQGGGKFDEHLLEIQHDFAIAEAGGRRGNGKIAVEEGAGERRTVAGKFEAERDFHAAHGDYGIPAAGNWIGSSENRSAEPERGCDGDGPDHDPSAKSSMSIEITRIALGMQKYCVGNHRHQVRCWRSM